jgi:F0F1-type ATP synthase delta subunit
MTTKEYAQALDILFQENPHAGLGKDFVRLLEKEGKLALLPGVIRELEAIEQRRARSMTCEVVSAHKDELHSALLHAKAFIKDEGGDPSTWTFQEKVDHSLIGGYVVRTPERELDMSDKRGLYRLYEKLRAAV